MRDPARIDRILELVRKAWIKHPDIRLGQLISNMYLDWMGDRCVSLNGVFSFEDSLLEDALTKAIGDENGS